MTRFAYLAAAPILLATSLALPAQAAEVQIVVSGPVVELMVVEEIEAEPDLVTVNAGVETQAATAVEALRLNSAEMRKVIDRIKSLSVAERDIQTTGITLNPRYDYDQRTQRQIFRGYTAGNTVSIKLRKIDQTGQILDALVAVGATNLNGPFFSLENDTDAKAMARRNAMERARAQALEYARLAGYSDIRLLEVSEAITGRSYPGPIAVTAQRAVAEDASAPVQPGMVSTRVNVTVKYEMTR